LPDMTDFEAVRALYEAYLGETERLEREKKPGDGLLGFGSGPKNDKCHGEFADAVFAALDKAAESGVPAEDAAELLRYIYRAPLENAENRLAYWMLIAVHGHTEGLVERLSPSVAAELLAMYESAYPRRERLPVQKRAVSALKARAGGG
jgi:hypothetical protein